MVCFFLNWIQFFSWFFRARLMSDTAKDLEILALRSQLAIVQERISNRKIFKPRFTPALRCLWVLLSNYFSGWQASLILVKPETVIGWYKTAFKFFWKLKSEPGRSKISLKTIAMIKRIHKENPLLSPEKIHDILVNLGITDTPAPNTIAKYIPKIRKAPTDKQRQSWVTFLKNHSNAIWSMDFFVVSTLCFQVLYVFLIVSHDRRSIIHYAVTAIPSSASFQSPWQNGICERTIGILRQELLNHVIPVNAKYLEWLLGEYIG
ncbi:MAG: integrase, partial [Firmicutes bacterium HGW-Firmicutes-12]